MENRAYNNTFSSAPTGYDTAAESFSEAGTRADESNIHPGFNHPVRSHDTSHTSERDYNPDKDGNTLNNSNPRTQTEQAILEYQDQYDQGFVEEGDAEAAQKKQKGPEGEYLAALRGSKSETWQNRTGGIPGGQNTYPGVGKPATGVPGTCFKCGLEGHWSKDCPTQGGMGLANGRESGGAGTPLEKACKCGAGACVVRTAKTEKNMGRQFYACPGATQVKPPTILKPACIRGSCVLMSV